MSKMEAKGSSRNINKQQNFELIRDELELLHQCCINNGTDAFKARKAADPFIQQMTARTKGFSLTTFFKAFFLLGLLAVLFSNAEVNKFIMAISRRATMSVLTLWDWRRLHDIPCFIPNPFKEDAGKQIGAEECGICANLTSVTRLDSSTMEEVSEKFLREEIPVIVRDSMQSAPVTLDNLYQLYLDDEVVNLYASCDFASSVDVHKKNHRLLLQKLRDGEHTSYYAHWQNCFKEVAKRFRQVSRRPHILPTTVELAPTNWVLISSNYTNTEPVQMPEIRENVVVLVQLSGFIDIILTPRIECEDTCRALTVQLVKGSVFIMTDLLYELEYRPTRGKLAITVGLGGSFDL